MLRTFLLLFIVALCAAEEQPPIERVLPDKGIELPAAVSKRLTDELLVLQQRIREHIAGQPLSEDIEVFAKALDFALRFGEFYNLKSDIAKADWLIAQAKQRLQQFEAHPWTMATGLVVRGYRSDIDGSVQPYGMVIPKKHDFNKPAPLYVWLHGRGSKVTDMHFMYERGTKPGQIAPAGALVLHAFGRQCIGFKSAGEMDVIDVIEEAKRHYRIDPDRVVLMGFSMGGGGVRTVGGHFTDRFAVIHAGAGYAETKLFMKYPPEQLPPAMEQTLWGLNDATCYVRNFFNVPYSEYSGDQDKQTQASDVMKAAFAEHGKTLRHFVGPMTAHKYHPDSLKSVLELINEGVVAGRPTAPQTVMLQTRTLRYNRMFWVEALGLDQHWHDSRIDATANGADLVVSTKNINRLCLRWPQLTKDSMITVDGVAVKVEQIPSDGLKLRKTDQGWLPLVSSDDLGLRKRPGQQGPIDDIFTVPFLVVEPTGVSTNAKFHHWSQCEAAHFHERWASAMRGDLRVKKDTEITDDDIKRYHLLLWGDASSNVVIAKVLKHLPMIWDEQAITVHGTSYAAADHALAMIYPNPLNPETYVVLNSALTWREANDRNNSLQNPKLGDWAIIGLDQPGDQTIPGRIVATDFFDEFWAVRR